MTEEFANTINKQPKAPRQSLSPETMLRTSRYALITGIVFLVITLIDSAFQYLEFEAWQILADAGGLLIALTLLSLSLVWHRRGKIHTANNLVPFVILFAFAPGDLFLEGVTLYNLISGILLFSLAYIILKPTNFQFWLSMLVAHVALVFIFRLINLARFDISLSSSWQVSLPITTAALAGLLGWQIIRNIQFRTLQSRLLLMFLGLGLIPAMVAITASTLIGYQRDLNQAENFLQTISTLKNEQISTWYNQIQIDINNLSQNAQFSELVYALVNTEPEDSNHAELLANIRTSMQQLQLETGRYAELSIVSLEGKILSSTRPGHEGFSIGENDSEGLTIGNKNYFIFGRTATYRTPLVFNRETGLPETQIYQPVTIPNGEIIAVLLGNINTENIIQRISETAQLGDTGEAYLVSIYNRLLTPLQNSQEIKPGESDTISSPAISDTIQNQGSRTTREDNFQNQPVIGTYSWNPELQTVLVVEQSENEAFQSLRQDLTINTVIGVITLAITLSIAFVTARNFSEPIKSLSEKVSEVWQGELKKIQPLDRFDEIGELSQTLSQMTEQLIQTTTNLEKTVTERTEVLQRRAKYLETTSQISRSLTSIYDIDNLLNTVTHLVSENFGFYHVGVFILDDQQEFAILRAANSEGGWKMLARGHKLRVGDQGIVGYVTGTGAPRIQQQVVGEDSIHFKNPDLPLTKSEMALPLKAGNTIFGALDVQSTDEQAFTEEDINVLQVLADSVAVAIQNTRLVQQLQERLDTERKLYGDLTRQGWVDLLGRKSFVPAFRSDKSGTRATTTSLSALGKQALRQGKTILGNPNDEQEFYPIAVPVKIRGGVSVAVIETQKHKSAGPWTKEEITILESVSEDLGMAMENARLVEETQKKAQRDRIAAELASKIWASSDVEIILQTAVRELGSALQVSRGTIQLSLPEDSRPENTPDGANRS